MFLAPSLLGIILFLLPVPFGGSMNTPIGHLKELILALLGHDLCSFAVPVVTFVIFILSAWAEEKRPEWVVNDHVLSEALLGGKIWIVIKFLGFMFSFFVVLNLLPGVFDRALFKYADNIILHLIPRLLVLILVLSFTVPLLLDFGLIQFTAVFATPVMRPLFRVPGRAAVDMLASVFGSSSMAVVITAKLHYAGFYTDREAATMVAGFSLPGIYTIYAFTSILDMTYCFLPILFVSIMTSFFIAMIIPRLWPLCSIPENYYTGHEHFYGADTEASRHGHSMLEWAFLRAESKASRMTWKLYMHEVLEISAPLLFCTVPLIIAVGIPLISFAERTVFVELIASPLTALLEYMEVEQASGIASSTIMAFLEPYISALYAQTLVSSQARFIYLAVSVVSLINIVEVGLHVWHSKIPLSFFHMIVLFVLRVVMAALIIVPVSKYFFS